MTEKKAPSIDREAFRALIDAYGSSPHRWPDTVRDGAVSFMETEEGRVLMTDADQLDAVLSRLQSPSPSTRLTAGILADGETWLARRTRLRRWAISAGLIGVGLAGGLTGAVAVVVVTPPPALSLNGTMTAFGELQSDSEWTQEAP
ncbi:Hypothetical protein RG1141_PA13720 (plasmid) [Neorhizobium galegae bv. officinalis bv. officinalis str. HAMBI 1141]|uniref:Transmembrane protein n=1 Tax=Neorhizobium galegae bv. officinalis bv. officinalis str. HAMBI 1141 TaxID=1028801 RepID=A0A068TJA6_NEOGA|nr:hypothetical protein [Neorhizobium galegae]CDN58204.1 Hypothetical protein RG1141_PA13720 [Neorhizobium galegae bv. officinalis bv. officinalis str. HAMBI 1141]